MSIATYEGIVKKGKIHLKAGVKLPENATVYVIIVDLKLDEKKPIRIPTPRLANRKQAADFKMTVTEVKSNARLRR